MANPNLLYDILSHLQNAEIVEYEEEFFFLIHDDMVVSFEENRSCIGKLIADRDVNVQGLRCCLCRAWRCSDFKIF